MSDSFPCCEVRLFACSRPSFHLEPKTWQPEALARAPTVHSIPHSPANNLTFLRSLLLATPRSHE